MRPPCVLALLLVGLAPQGGAGRLPDQVPYTRIVNEYREGRFQEAVEALLRMPASQWIRAADSFVKTTLTLQPVPVRLLEAAFALETEATIAIGRPVACAAPREPPDGWPHGMPLPLRRTQIHDALEDTSARMPDYAFLLAWYRLVVAYDQGRGDLHNALVCIDTAPPRIKADSEIMLALGAIHESAWNRLAQDQIRTPGVEPDLNIADTNYRNAFHNVTPVYEARVRLARVLMLRADFKAAVDLLQDAGEHLDTDFRYLALLFLGSALEEQQDYDRAADAYRRARVLIPTAQSAAIAEAHLVYLLGKRDEAATIVRALATPPLGTANTDPWLWYEKGTARRTAGYLQQVRAILSH